MRNIKIFICVPLFYRVFFVLSLILLGGCQSNGEGDASLSELDYSNGELWFATSGEQLYETDVFYILPTCIWDWSDENGVVQNYADPFNEEQREAMRPSYELAEDIFASQSNYYAPYYRQISLNSWLEGENCVAERFPAAMEDIKLAFEYFIEEYNCGRPFIIAGFSQGGKCVVELLKIMPDSLYSRMVAAYAIGYKVSAEEVEEYSTITLASGQDDLGSVISYNSVENELGVSGMLSPTVACINPINWQTDSSVATVRDGVTVHVDESSCTLFVDGLDSEEYYIEELMPLLPLGNYHLQELTLYQESLTQNVQDRIENFNSQTKNNHGKRDIYAGGH